MKKRIWGSLWTNKQQKQLYRGRYKWLGYKTGPNGLPVRERVFELVGERTGRVITMESAEMAKKLKWRKV